MRNQSELLLLLEFLYGDLPADERELVQLKVNTDVEFAGRLERIQAFENSSSTGNSKTLGIRSSIEPEYIAAVIDGKVSSKGIERLEAECWKSDRLLSEVVENFRFSREASELEPATNAQVNSVLASIGIDTNSRQTSGPSARPGDDPAANETGRPKIQVVDLESADESSTPSTPMLTKRKFNSRIVLVVSIAAGLLLAVTLGLLALRMFRQQPDLNVVTPTRPGTNNQAESPRFPEGGSPERGEGENTNSSDEFSQSSDSNEERSDLPEALPDSNAVPDAPVVPDADPTAPSQQPQQDRRPDPLPAIGPGIAMSTDSPPELQAVSTEWMRKKRGSALQRSADGEWAGIDVEVAEPMLEFLTLSDSWTQLEVQGFGIVTLTANTQVKIYRLPDRDEIVFDLIKGEIVIPTSNVPRQFLLKYHPVAILAKTEGDTGMLARWTFRSVETYVFEGNAVLQTIENELMSVNSQSQGGTRDCTPDHARIWYPFTGAITDPADMEFPGRLRMPAGKKIVDNSVHRKILESTSVEKDLLDLSESRREPTRQFAQAALLATDPVRYFKSYLSSVKEEDQEVAMLWYLNQSKRSRNRLFINEDEFDFPELLRSSLDHLIGTRRPIDNVATSKQKFNATLAYDLAYLLAHEEMPVRAASYFCLQHAVDGRLPRIQYSASAAPPQLAEAVLIWQEHVIELSEDAGSSIQKPNNNRPTGEQEKPDYPPENEEDPESENYPQG